jgi:signal transduction histidine kinase
VTAFAKEPAVLKLPLHILHLEDEPDDAFLVQALLEEAGIACRMEVVETREAFIAALREGKVDLVLSDHTLPTFDGMTALDLAIRMRPEVPFIILSGTMGEEWAVNALKNGATDYVLKERPARLVPAIRRAMREVEEAAERRRLERQFIEAQKMEVMGRLVGGVAHDFNNILSVIMGYCESVGAGMDAGHPLRSDIEEMRLAGERGAALVRQLLVFSSKQVVQPAVIDLNERVEAFQKMLRRLIGENIAMTVVAAPSLGRIKADPSHVGQVLMNMVVNARDAMPHGGELVIRTRNVDLAEPRETTRGTIPPGSYVQLVVRDNGVGMSQEVQEHIFEAFYTTKAKGIGTGLGLATCNAIVKQCGGFIDVISRPDAGATFEIYFPRVEQPLDVKARPVPSGPLPRGTETVLLVEDDPALNRLAGRTLRKLGYTVLCTSNGEEGLRLALEHRGRPLSLVVTDVVMPQMGGQMMAERLAPLFPELKFIFTSGYAGEILARHGALKAGASVLPKPYTPSILARKVRDVLDAPAANESGENR